MARTGKFVVNKSTVEPCRIRDKQTPAEHAAAKHSQLTALQRLEYVLLLCNRLLIGFVTIYLCWMCLRLRSTQIPWHALLCTLGFVCLMSEGLLAHHRGNAWTHLCYRTEKTRTHWILQLLGSVIGMAGIIIKLHLEEVHFQTLHAKFGCATLVLCLISLVSGMSSLYANELKDHMQPLINKAAHNCIGLSTYALAMLSMYYAFKTDIFLEYSPDAAAYMDFRLLMQVIVVLILVLSSYGPLWCLIYSKLWKCC